MFAFLRKSSPRELPDFRDLFDKFHRILNGNNRVLEIMAELEDKNSGDYIFDINYLIQTTSRLSEEVVKIITDLNVFSGNKYTELFEAENEIHTRLNKILANNPCPLENRLVVALDEIDPDCEAVVGNKMARLAEIQNHIQIPVPNGFAITTTAYRQFIEQNLPAAEARDSYSKEEIEARICAARLPRTLRKQLKKAVRRLKRQGCQWFAIRSSSVTEDQPGQSFAGQFRSVLQITEKEIEPHYKKIVAGSFQASLYSREDDGRREMAVIVQEMVPAVAAGVMYTQDPADPAGNTIVISAVFGLGAPLVSGEVNGDVYRVSRSDIYRPAKKSLAQKETQLTVADDGKLIQTTVPQEKQTAPCLSDDQIVRLAEIGFVLERNFQRPQDVEWALCPDGGFVILQTRPLQLPVQRTTVKTAATASRPKPPVLFRDKGMIACRGMAAGKVVIVDESTPAESFPTGAVAVARTASPRLGGIIKKSAALITDFGNTTTHLATLAREFGVPAIVGTECATKMLKPGQEITVDAEENIVYDGIHPEMLIFELDTGDVFRELPEYKILRRLLKSITPLNLTDPSSSRFSPRYCRTYHDIIRYAHEKAVQELIQIDISKKRFPGLQVKEIKLIVPLHLKVIDIGGGLKPAVNGADQITLEEVESLPMKEILAGVTAPNVWSTDPVELQFGDFMSSITRFSMTDDGGSYQGDNLAVISREYMNLSLRLGYHFNVIDAFVSENPNNNHIYFRFVGGVTTDERRERRAKVIKTILEEQGFTVTVQRDLVIAKLGKLPAEHLGKCLFMLGKLIGFTRQLDARMRSERSVEEYVKLFLQHYCQ